MKVIFAGTPEFARVALERLHAAGYEIPLVLTQPDRPAGRGMKLQASAVKQFAQGLGLTVVQPRSLRLDGKYPEDAAAARAAIEAADADVMVVAAYGLILPQWVLNLMSQPTSARVAVTSEGAIKRSEGPPRASSAPSGGSAVHAVTSVGAIKHGCLNIHASLLPRWRGAAPIHRAIEAGDSETGVTIMQMDAGLDTGDMLLMEKLPMVHAGPGADTTGTLHDKLALLGGRMIVQALALAARGGLAPVRQPDAGVSYAHKIEKHEAQIDWAESAELIARRVRAFNPFPGAFSALAGETLKIWRASARPAALPALTRPGEILSVGVDGIEVAAMNSIVTLLELQRAGGKRLQVADFLRGFELAPGMVFEPRHASPAETP
jgi:methionyl-tRNA formyltransferase